MDYIVDASDFLTALKPLVKVSAVFTFPKQALVENALAQIPLSPAQLPGLFLRYDCHQRTLLSCGFWDDRDPEDSWRRYGLHVCLKP